jgi:hypothetical protein
MVYGSPRSLEEGTTLHRSRRSTSRGRCEHATYPVEVLPVDGGKKKIAHCLGCGRSGPVCEGSTEALMALRETPRLAFEQRTA